MAHFYQCVRNGRGENHARGRSRNELLPDMVPQPAYAIDIYVDGIAVRKRKFVARYDSGPSHQIGASRERVIAKEKIGELTRFAFEFSQSCLAAEDHRPVARDREDNSR